MPRALWKGFLSFGLVSIPVELFSAEDHKEFKFSMLDKRDFSPVGYKRYSKKSGKEVEWSNIIKGYEYGKGHYVVLSDEDFRRANVKASKTIDIQPKLASVWTAVEQKARMGTCNDYFKTLNSGKSLAEILSDGDITIHLLEPKAGSTYADLPYANTAGRDIGIDPNLLFDAQQSNLVCTLIHELAHVGGATTNVGAAFAQAHAAEAALPKCGCSAQYQRTTIGSIRSLGGGRFGYA